MLWRTRLIKMPYFYLWGPILWRYYHVESAYDEKNIGHVVENEDEGADDPQIEHIGVEDEEEGHAMMKTVLIKFSLAVEIRGGDVRYERVKVIGWNNCETYKIAAHRSILLILRELPKETCLEPSHKWNFHSCNQEMTHDRVWCTRRLSSLSENVTVVRL